MGIDKFLDDIDEIKIPKKDYKSKVDKTLKTKFDDDIEDYSLNLISPKMNKDVKLTSKKISMSIYFEENDLMLLKAVSQFNNTTVNKTIMSILEYPLKITRNSLPQDFDIDILASKYDNKSKKKKVKC